MTVCVCVCLTLHNNMNTLCHGGPQGVGGIAAVVAFVQSKELVIFGSQRPGSLTLRPKRLPVLHPAETTERRRSLKAHL